MNQTSIDLYNAMLLTIQYWMTVQTSMVNEQLSFETLIIDDVHGDISQYLASLVHSKLKTLTSELLKI